MPKKKFSDEQIAFALRQADSGTAVGEICRKCVFLHHLIHQDGVTAWIEVLQRGQLQRQLVAENNSQDGHDGATPGSDAGRSGGSAPSSISRSPSRAPISFARRRPTANHAELSRQISLATHPSHGITKALAGRASQKNRRWRLPRVDRRQRADVGPPPRENEPPTQSPRTERIAPWRPCRDARRCKVRQEIYGPIQQPRSAPVD